VLGLLGDEPVAVRSGSIMAATFHPELTDDDRLHGQFLAGIANTSGE
jgi:5'-phosphate synthase pdxT subunit